MNFRERHEPLKILKLRQATRDRLVAGFRVWRAVFAVGRPINVLKRQAQVRKCQNLQISHKGMVMNTHHIYIFRSLQKQSSRYFHVEKLTPAD